MARQASHYCCCRRPLAQPTDNGMAADSAGAEDIRQHGKVGADLRAELVSVRGAFSSSTLDGVGSDAEKS